MQWSYLFDSRIAPSAPEEYDTGYAQASSNAQPNGKPTRPLPSLFFSPDSRLLTSPFLYG